MNEPLYATLKLNPMQPTENFGPSKFSGAFRAALSWATIGLTRALVNPPNKMCQRREQNPFIFLLAPACFYRVKLFSITWALLCSCALWNFCPHLLRSEKSHREGFALVFGAANAWMTSNWIATDLAMHLTTRLSSLVHSAWKNSFGKFRDGGFRYSRELVPWFCHTARHVNITVMLWLKVFASKKWILWKRPGKGGFSVFDAPVSDLQYCAIL